MRDNQPLLGQQCRQFYSNMARTLLDTDFRLYQRELTLWMTQKTKEKRAKRIVGRINSLRRP